MVPLTRGRVAQHAPRNSGGYEAALIDVAQDVLLSHLSREGLFDLLVFKGGTALRKLYAGTGGRFSTDLDFSLRSIGDDRESVTQLLVSTIEGYSTPEFTFSTEEHRGRHSVTYTSTLGDVANLTTKLDVGPPVWLEPTDRAWVPASIHSAYELPETIPAMSVEENLAEKIARLNRRRLARDLYDLWWIGQTPPHNSFDETLVTNLAALKCWVDTYGATTTNSSWIAVDGATLFDPTRWLENAADVDDESIGLLMHPPPDIAKIQDGVVSRYGFLRNLPAATAEACDAGPRGVAAVKTLIAGLPGGQFTSDTVFY